MSIAGVGMDYYVLYIYNRQTYTAYCCHAKGKKRTPPPKIRF